MDSNSEKDTTKQQKYIMGLATLLGIDDEQNDPHDDERHDTAGFTKDYLQRTSLHGLQYIGENNRSLFERIFWVFSFTFGAFGACYFILNLWDKWETSPVYVSVETTTYPIPEIPFPAVTVCSVNKIEEYKLIKTLEAVKTQTDRFNYVNESNLHFMLSAMIRYETVDTKHEFFNNPLNLSTSDLLKIFKSAMPSCQDMVMHCNWMGQIYDCRRLFKVMTTDDGFCCVFNAVDPLHVLKNESSELPEDYDFLENTEYVHVSCPEGAVNCTEGWKGGDFDDWYDEERKWQAPQGATRKKRNSDQVQMTGALEAPQHAQGAGVSMGLTIMLYANKHNYFLTSAFYEGFKILVHNPEEFPAVREKGFIVGPGTEMFVGVDATDVYSTEAIRNIKLKKRNCHFHDEKQLEHYKNYSRSGCMMECQAKVINHLCKCQPYFYNIRGKDIKICGLPDIPCLNEHAYKLKMLAFPTDEVYEELKEAGIECSCPAGCNELKYSIETSYAPYPSERARESEIVQEVFPQGSALDVDFFREETTLLHVFFKNEFIIQFKRDTLYTVNDFISNMGGLMGLCMGFSMLSVVEIVYWFCVRWGILIFKRKKQSQDVKPMDSDVDHNIKQTTSKVFDELFDAKHADKNVTIMNSID